MLETSYKAITNCCRCKMIHYTKNIISNLADLFLWVSKAFSLIHWGAFHGSLKYIFILWLNGLLFTLRTLNDLHHFKNWKPLVWVRFNDSLRVIVHMSHIWNAVKWLNISCILWCYCIYWARGRQLIYKARLSRKQWESCNENNVIEEKSHSSIFSWSLWIKMFRLWMWGYFL